MTDDLDPRLHPCEAGSLDWRLARLVEGSFGVTARSNLMVYRSIITLC
jgi:hypothetical protein